MFTLDDSLPLPAHVHTRPRLNVTLAKMRPSDIEAVARLEKLCHVLSWSANAYATELGNPNAYYAVAKTDDGTLAGYGGIWVIVDELHVTTLGTDPTMRGRSVADKLILTLMAAGIERGATRATLEVRESNVAALKLYEKYGFEAAAKRKHYYSDNREHAIIMWAEGLATPEYGELLLRRRAELFGV